MPHHSNAEDSNSKSLPDNAEGLRKRKIHDSEIKEVLDGNINSPVEEDCMGCPLPSIPVNENTLDTEMYDILKATFLGTGDELDLSTLVHNATGQAEEVVKKLLQVGWNVCHFQHLPDWLQDNDFLIEGHRPPLSSFRECFKSIFRLHTETANIWTHLVGCAAFIIIALYFISCPSMEVQLQEKIVFGIYFAGGIACLGCSALFHTVMCHSQPVGKLFSKLDYCGIALLIMGSFIPWLYYGFYCHFVPKVLYLTMTTFLGTISIAVSLMDRFSKPAWRPCRVGVFVTFGLSAIAPGIHYLLLEGWHNKLSQRNAGLIVLMGSLYIFGAMVYALRVPERWLPGKCDIWFSSHQIFHVFVLAGAFVHYHTISEMAMHRVAMGKCEMVESPVY